MTLLQGGGTDLPNTALADMASIFMSQTGGNPAGVLLKLIGLKAIES
jgi:hypothetical protein